MGEKKVTNIKKKQKEVITNEHGLTAAEIGEQIRRDEEEMDRRLSKFAQFMPLNADASSITEENEDDEEFVVDLDKGVVTQVESTLLVRDTPAHSVDWDPTVPANLPPIEIKVDLGAKYGKLMRDLLVRKAVAKLIRSIRDEEEKLENQRESMPAYVAETLGKAIEDVSRKAMELLKIIRHNEVHYEDIPEWATRYIEDYIEHTLTNLILLAED
jgi:hypothetical protein